MTCLVTGGAGYIGSHIVASLQAHGYGAVAVDNMSSGVATRIPGVPLLTADISAEASIEAMATFMREHKVTAVIHTAALKSVPESVADPLSYYRVNVGGTTNLLEAMKRAGVVNFVFSSTAAVYGMAKGEVTEDSPTLPINPYGETKLIGEWLAADSARAWGLRQANLRYFNVAGAGWPDLADTAVMNLVPIVFAALRDGKAPKVFGDDYATPDGSCVRDYVHVLDLAEAHLAALDYLERDDRPHTTFNVGTGTGSSVFEVIEQIRRTTGQHFEIDVAERRAGDPPYLCADVSRIRETLDWRAKNGLGEIIDSAWAALQA